jgi:hypothetical protein
MDKTSEYLLKAAQCRSAASSMGDEDRRAQLLKVADAWDHMAEEHAAAFRSVTLALKPQSEWPS